LLEAARWIFIQREQSRSIRVRPLTRNERSTLTPALSLKGEGVVLNQGGTTEASFVLAIERGFFISMTNEPMTNGSSEWFCHFSFDIGHCD
jgi:hypothetical protein